MDQEKRIMLAVGFSLLALMLWQALFVKQPPAPTKPTAPAQTRAAQSSPSPATAQKPLSPAPLPVLQGNEAKEIVVESELYRVTFSTQGAVVKSWVLKKYRDGRDNLLDVVNGPACEKLGFPMSLSVPDEVLKSRLNSALYAVTPGGTSLKPPVKVEFAYSDGKIQARKQFVFGPGYEVQAEVSLFDGLQYLPVEVAWPGGFGDNSLPPAAAILTDRAVYRLADSSKVREEGLSSSWLSRLWSGSRGAGEGPLQEEIPGPLALAGLEDRYFAGIFLPDSPEAKFHISRQTWTPPDWKGEEKDKPKPLLAGLGSSQLKPLAFRLFVAPKDLDVLRSVKPPLDSLVDFGWFSIVAKPLFLGLQYIHERLIHNYGWAIVILTVFINLAMFPLKLKSIRSAQEMQRIAPLVKSIQEKYKQYKFNDPRKQRMNQEVMKLYQEHGINPLGGCLPMLLQLPFLYAFYSVLNLSIELRHAPWLLWVKDLSTYDPLYILPIVMTLTMFILQRMTPMTSADPAQQRMFMFMPLFFGFMFLKLASGLVLYWLTGNIVGIAQQAFINKMMPTPQTLPVPRKAAEAKN